MQSHWNRRRWMGAWILLASGSLAGCSDRVASSPASDMPTTTPPAAATNLPAPARDSEPQGSPQAAADAVSVRAVDGEMLANSIQQHRGRVVLVDFWATWCLPCVEMFPHTVRLHRQYADQGLTVVSVSMDDPENEPQVLEFLVSQGATFSNFISRYGLGSEAIEAFNIKNGTLPYVRLYDRSGAVHRHFEGPSATPKEIEQAVRSLLAEGNAP